MKTRDSESVERLIVAIRLGAMACPDMRVGQLISNATFHVRGDNDPYYLENDKLEAAIYQFLKDFPQSGD